MSQNSRVAGLFRRLTGRVVCNGVGSERCFSFSTDRLDNVLLGGTVDAAVEGLAHDILEANYQFGLLRPFFTV